MTYVISSPCIDVKDRACIYEGPRMLFIHPDECVDCGACEPVCPEEATFYTDDVPADSAAFIAINAVVFDDLGSPGGAGGAGPLAADHPDVRAMEVSR
jgi:NAD-dependent dihydropyrimidine dehydrogenase PreA subunit